MTFRFIAKHPMKVGAFGLLRPGQQFDAPPAMKSVLLTRPEHFELVVAPPVPVPVPASVPEVVALPKPSAPPHSFSAKSKK